MKKWLVPALIVLVLLGGGIFWYMSSQGLAAYKRANPNVNFSYCDGVSNTDGLKQCATEAMTLAAKKDNRPELCDTLPIPERKQDCLTRVDAFQNLKSSALAFCGQSDKAELCQSLYTILLAAESYNPAQCASIPQSELRTFCEAQSRVGAPANADTLSSQLSFVPDCRGDATCQKDLDLAIQAVKAGNSGACPNDGSLIAQRCPFEVAVYAGFKADDVSVCSQNQQYPLGVGRTVLDCVTQIFLAKALAANDLTICDGAAAVGGDAATCKALFPQASGGRFDYLK